ncbi:MAG: carboxypeptidase regulatory-like domain-containing protein [Bryobacteraceae bacterium]|nr:carboxypeptidase regulatory-like domain-containing protein [Bryobacteraceae bacterium]
MSRIFCFLFLASVSAWAQALSSLNGAVSDGSGAAVPNAKLELTSLENGVKREAVTGREGTYAFPQIQPGRYRLTVQASGFSAKSFNDLLLAVATPTTQNVQLEVGVVTEVVSVEAAATQVNIRDASLGNHFGPKAILELPMEGRNIIGLLALQPGVTYYGENGNSYRSGNVNGGKSDQANITLDGVDVNDQQDRTSFTAAIRLPLDTVQEFRIQTTGVSADFGRTSGAQITLASRSGTNDLHGSAYWFLRNKATNANSFFNNLNGVPLAKLNRNIYGGTIGGPIQRNRLFFFGNFEGRQDRREDSILRLVPTASLRRGEVQYLRTDRSVGLLTPADLRTRIDPLGLGPSTAALNLLSSYPLPNDFSTGDGLNTAGFRFNAPIRLHWKSYMTRLDYTLDKASRHTVFLRGQLQDDTDITAPQFPGLSPNNTNLNGSRALGAGLNSVLSPTQINSFRFGLTRASQESTGVLLGPFVSIRGLADRFGTARPIIRKTPVYTFSDDFTWLKGNHEWKIGGIARMIRNNRVNFAKSFNDASVNSSWLANTGADINAPITDLATTFRTAFRDAALATLGVISQVNAYYNYDKSGRPLAPGAAVARQFNNDEYELYAADTWKVTRNLTASFGLRWSLMPPIHEGTGLQTSTRQPLSEFFAQRASLAGAGLPQSQTPPVEYLLKENGGRDLYSFNKKNFGPRASLAYSPQIRGGLGKLLFGAPGRSVVRAGWGLYYDLFGSGLITTFDAVALGLATNLTNPSGSQTLSSAPRYTGFNNIPAQLTQPAPTAGFPQTAPAIQDITTAVDDRIRAPYSMNFNLSVGRDLDHGWFVETSYVGRESRRSLIYEDMAQPTNLRDPASGATYFEAATQLMQLSRARTPVANVGRIPYWENLFPGAASATQSATQRIYQVFDANGPDTTNALYSVDVNCRPSCSKFGRFAYFNEQYSFLRALRSVGSGSYHGFQMTVRKRFTNGDQIHFNYTLSKSIDLGSRPESSTASNGTIINSWNRSQFRAVSDFDARHQLNANLVYGLPFGKGKPFLHEGRLMNRVFGGWQLGALYRQQSGLPISVSPGRNYPTNWNAVGYATPTGIPFADGTNKNAQGPVAGGASGPNIFQDPRAALNSWDFTFPGQSGSRNSIRGDGNFNIDMNLSKSVAMPWSENHTVQLRWDVFNVTNSTRFDPFFTSLSLGSTGTFGKYTDTFTLPRVMQFSLRYNF